MHCLLCESTNLNGFSHQNRKGQFWRCDDCEFVFLDPAERVSAEKEKQRYESHQNSIESAGYLQSFQPIIEGLKSYHGRGLRILDYGSGPYPMLAEKMREFGHQVEIYDPFFAPALPKGHFDLVTCTEVIEHCYDPVAEILKMRALIGTKGELQLMTQISDNQELESWWYLRDFTHVCFFSKKSFQVLFKKLFFQGRLENSVWRISNKIPDHP